MGGPGPKRRNTIREASPVESPVWRVQTGRVAAARETWAAWAGGGDRQRRPGSGMHEAAESQWASAQRGGEADADIHEPSAAASSSSVLRPLGRGACRRLRPTALLSGRHDGSWPRKQPCTVMRRMAPLQRRRARARRKGGRCWSEVSREPAVRGQASRGRLFLVWLAANLNCIPAAACASPAATARSARHRPLAMAVRPGSTAGATTALLCAAA